MDHPIQAKSRLDRFIEWASPAWAAGRYAARASIEVARSMPFSSRRGAISSRVSTPWNSSTSFRGGRAADRRDLADMRDRARRVYLQNPIGGSLLDTETDNVVAEGFGLHMKTASPEFNTEAQERFADWIDRADVSGMMSGADLFRTSWSEPRKDGDGGFVLISQGGVPRLQYIPGDLIVNPRKGFNARNTFDGVEVDAAGRPVRFHVRDVDEAGKDTVTPIDARDFVYIAHRRGEPNSVRGVTVYERTFGLLDQIDAYLDAVIIAARMAAIMGLVMKRNKPQVMLDKLAQLQNSQGNWQRGLTVENGMMQVIGTDEEVVQVQAHQPMTQTPDFLRACFRIVCLTFDMPLEIGQKDLSQVNFSGGRIGLIAYYRSCRVKQNWLKRHWKRIVFWWLSKERQRQQLGFPDAFKSPFPEDYGKFELHGREWDYNDPLTEAQADFLEMCIGLASPQQKCKERNIDFEETQRQIAEAFKLRRSLGIPILVSNYTRNESQKVTAVDAQGNPLRSDAAQPLNGAQITAALDVMTRLRERALSADAAAELLAQIGIDRQKAAAMASSVPKLDAGGGDVAFKREVLKSLLSVPQAREAVYNATDIEDLIGQTGLTPEKGYEVPYAAVVAPSGPLNSGAVIRDPDGDIVGADVENELPMDAPTDGGATRNGSESAAGDQGGEGDEEQQGQSDPLDADPEQPEAPAGE